MVGRCGEGSAGGEVQGMVTEGSREGKMGIHDEGGQGFQMATEPIVDK